MKRPNLKSALSSLSKSNLSKRPNSNIEKGIYILIAIYGLEGIAANLAHPVTPGLLKVLEMPDYMFGVIYAVMQLCNFLFSPFWGAACKHTQPRTILLIGCVGYGVGQAFFGAAQNAIVLLIGRAIAGTFFSATVVASVYALVQSTTPATRKAMIPMLITAFTVMGTFGQWIGGYLGEWNLYAPFVLQVSLLVLCGLLYFFLLPKVETEGELHLGKLLTHTNPFRSLLEIRNYLTPLFAIQFGTVFFLSFASTSVSQTFGYYIVDVMQAGSSVNGFARGVTGLISIGLNVTLTVRIVKSRHVERNTGVIALMSAIALLSLSMFATVQTPFVALAIVAMSFDTVLVSAAQERSSAYAEEDSQAMIAGFHNSMKSLGAILGALIAGVVYGWDALLPFLLAATIYIIAIVTLQISSHLHRAR